jgi:hypothetical protein
MRRRNTKSRSFSFLGGVLAFALSAVMGVGFVALVNKTHDLFSRPQPGRKL